MREGRWKVESGVLRWEEEMEVPGKKNRKTTENV